MSGTFSQTLAGYRVVATRAGADSLREVAAREMGDASQWPTLAAINGLVPPYITSNLANVRPGVIFAGSPIKVPATGASPSGVADTDDVDGTDILLVNGEFADNGAGDLQTVSGVANLAQAISNRLATQELELVYYPTYCCRVYELIGQGAGPATNQLAAAYVQQSVLGDPRISDASSATASLTGDQVTVSGSAVSTSGRAVPIGLPGTPASLTAPTTPQL